jgi:hypothetical protein
MIETVGGCALVRRQLSQMSHGAIDLRTRSSPPPCPACRALRGRRQRIQDGRRSMNAGLCAPAVCLARTSPGVSPT